jgi:hypothetical protein
MANLASLSVTSVFMQAKNNRLIQGQSTVSGIIIFLVAAAIMVYWLIPNTGVLFNRNVVDGAIDDTSNYELSVSYVNVSDHQTYYLSRKIDSRLEQYLKSSPTTIKVTYSRFFPENATLCEVESDHSLLAICSILTIITTAFFIIKDDLIKHFL